MSYGIGPAREIVQAWIHAALSGLNGVHCIADDILISGYDETIAERDYDRNLIALLQQCQHKGLKLNRSQLRLNRESMIYMRHELTSSGLRAEKRKVEAILNLPIPEDKKGLRRVLGMATFLARYCAHFSEITSVLTECLHTGNEYEAI